MIFFEYQQTISNHLKYLQVISTNHWWKELSKSNAISFKHWWGVNEMSYIDKWNPFMIILGYQPTKQNIAIYENQSNVSNLKMMKWKIGTVDGPKGYQLKAENTTQVHKSKILQSSKSSRLSTTSGFIPHREVSWNMGMNFHAALLRSNGNATMTRLK